jgi:uncharacterized membrane protein YhaH (DUF805 family)
MADVFISYAREDHPRAEQVARGLEAIGLKSFWDTDIPPGQTWSDYIEGKLSQCPVVIVLWSEHSTKSQWVREEARMGRDKSKLIPAMLDGSPAPFGFGEVQAADLSSWRGELNHPAWLRFSQAIHNAARGAEAPMPAPQALPQPQPAWTPPQTQMAAGTGGQLSPIGYVQKCLRLYADGKGRARRAEYWWWIAFVIGVWIVAYVVDLGVGGINPYTGAPNSQIIMAASALALLAPGLAVTSRRLHDIGMNGWLAAALFGTYVVGGLLAQAAFPAGAVLVLAYLGAIVALGALASKPGINQYGPNPKGA